jgi:hypothetical protein
MDKTLRMLGAIIIILAVISGAIILANIDWHEYNLAKRVYQDLPDNPYARQDYLIARNIVFPQIVFAIATIFSGIVSGLFFGGMAAIIELLQKNEQSNQQIISLLQQSINQEYPASDQSTN